MLRLIVHILLLRPFIKLFSGVTVIGKEHLHDVDNYIIFANHNSHLDIFVLFSLIPIRDIHRTYAVADKEYFTKSRILYFIVNFLFKPVFVTRSRHFTHDDPLKEMKERIAGGDNLIIFPEGTRGDAGKISSFKSGIGRLVAGLPDIPLIPVFVSGPERGLPKSTSLLLPFWNVVILGPPQKNSGDHREITRHLENTLFGLSQSQAAQRQKRIFKKKKHALSIAFLGIDGSGKSTLSRLAAQTLSDSTVSCLVSDNLEFYDNGTLKNIQPFVTEKIRHTINIYAKRAKSLKLYKIPKLTELLLRNHLHQELERWYAPDYILLDGSPLLNVIAWASLYKKDKINADTCLKSVSILSRGGKNIPKSDPIYSDFHELIYLKRLHLNSMIMPDVVLFIDVKPSTSCSRIIARGEPRQMHETESKLTDLREAYLMLCEVLSNNLDIPVLILDGEKLCNDVYEEGISFIRSTILSKGVRS